MRVPVLGYEGYYEVTDDGEVFSLPRPYRKIIGRQLSKIFDTNGYYFVTLSKLGIRSKVSVHYIVLSSFKGKSLATKHQVAHNDGCRTNNNLENLRWATVAENQKDKVLHGTSLTGERNPNRKLTWDAVRSIRNQAKHGLSYKEIANMHMTSSANVGYIVRYVTWIEK